MRFIINLPQEELESVERICFQVEEAQWFYEDFIRPLDPDLPSLNLKTFCLRIFQHCPLLSEFSSYHHSTAFSEFLAYKTRVPVRGAIMLNQDMDHVVLVKGWKKSANWSFPRGKINKDEPDLECAIREVYEETGFDLKDARLIGNPEDMKYIDVTMREQQMRLYIFRGVPMDTHFEPRTRKEISKIQWYKLSELPTLKKQKQHQDGRGEDLAVNANKFYMVAPFMVPLKKWIAHRKKSERLNSLSQPSAAPVALDDNIATLEDQDSRTENLDISLSPDKLGHIVAKLRQSDAAKPDQARPLSDLPEVLKSPTSTQDASAHLKKLLRVAPGVSIQHATPPVSHVSATPSPSDLLALLQPAGPREKPSVTPLEKVAELPLAPRSTNPMYNYQQSSSRLPPSSVFSTHLGSRPQAKTQPTIPHSALLSQNSMNRSPNQPTLHQEYPYSTHALEPTADKKAYESNSDLQTLPPYQRTGDPDFARNSQIPNIHQLLVPSADTLPRPKLNTHSSALLNLFKNAKSPESKSLDVASVTKPDVDRQPNVVEQSLKVQPNGNHPQGSESKGTLPFTHLPSGSLQKPVPNESSASNPTPMNDNKSLPRHHESRPEIQALEGSHHSLPQVLTLKSNNLAQTRSKHQDALLDLFRNSVLEAVTSAASPKQPSTTSPTQALEPPSLLAELSALPSPAHSREPSRVDTKSPVLMSQKTDSPSKISNRPKGSSNSSKPPVSATVNGPLNVPQFDVLARTAREAKSKAPKKHAVPPTQSPITIISRQVRSRDPLSLVKQKTPACSEELSEPPSSVRTDPRSLTLNPIVTDVKTTLHQPQILRRPAQMLASSDISAAPSPIQPLPSPKHRLAFDHRTNQSKEQKQALLSLFGRPSPPTSPGDSKSVNIISPLSGRNSVLQTQSPAVPPIVLRSKMSSLASGTGEASIRVGNGIKTPKTTAADKSFLLGYLEGVANGERR